MRFHHRLILCSAVPALLFVAALGVSVWGLLRTQEDFDRYIGTEQALAADLSGMYAQGLQMGQALRNIVLDPQNPRAYENLENARKAYEQLYDSALQVAARTPFREDVAQLAQLRQAQARAQEEVLSLVKTDSAAATARLNAAETPAWRQLRGELLRLVDATKANSAAAHATTQARVNDSRNAALTLAVVAIGVSAVFLVLMQRTIRRELGGDPADARLGLRAIAAGDLTHPLHIEGAEDSLMGELVQMQRSLQELVAQLGRSVECITTASGEIAAGSQDLSSRTEQAASNLQQTASSMEQLTGTVKQSADAAAQANQLACSASEVATRGGQVVSQVVATMDEINAASKKIADIIGVIDGIAFQTNILALNAAVEAARAGEQGRGFAVVAGEVRNLAQRSAQAAKEIKSLIGASVEKVESGAKLVQDAGSTMSQIVASVQRVTDIIGEISAAAAEQNQGIGQINTAVVQLDQMTQQNAALVEESAAAAESLKEQALRLAQMVRSFRIEDQGYALAH